MNNACHQSVEESLSKCASFPRYSATQGLNAGLTLNQFKLWMCQNDIACDSTSPSRAALTQPIMWTLAIDDKLLLTILSNVSFLFALLVAELIPSCTVLMMLSCISFKRAVQLLVVTHIYCFVVVFHKSDPAWENAHVQNPHPNINSGFIRMFVWFDLQSDHLIFR